MGAGLFAELFCGVGEDLLPVAAAGLPFITRHSADTHRTPVTALPLSLPTGARCQTPRGSFVSKQLQKTPTAREELVSLLFFPGQKGDFLGGGQKEEQLCFSRRGAETRSRWLPSPYCVLPKIFRPSPCLGSHQLVRTMVDTDCMKNQAKQPVNLL